MISRADFRKLNPLGRVLYFTGCVRFYRDGDGIGHIFRWWHPLSWLFWVAMLQLCGILGEPINEVVPFRLRSYWRLRRNEIEWL